MRESEGGSIGCPARVDVAESLWSLLRAVDDGRVQATATQRSYLEGVAIAMSGLLEFEPLDADPLDG